MAIPSRQIGWGTTDNLLWQISKQLEAITGVAYNSSGGIVGPQGPTGPQGSQGVQGVQGVQGDTGAQGSAGNSITLLGSYADLAAFNAGAGSLPGANVGDSWILLSDGSLMTWNGTNWFDAGDIKGPQGDQGVQGIQGVQGEQGIQGVQGIQGIQGIQGEQGVMGVSGLFAQTANSAIVTNTTAESTLIGSGVGSLIIPANGFTIGNSFSGRIIGHISSKNNTTIRIAVKSGAVILGDTGLITMPQTTNKHYTIDLNFTVRTIGTAGVASIATGIVFTYSKDASNAFEGSDSSIINNTTFNTTSSNTLDVTVTWGAADALNSIYSEYFTLNKVY